MNQGRRPVRTYNNQNLNHRERAALFTGASSTETNPALRSSAPSSNYTPNAHLDLESQNDDKLEGLTGKVKLLKEITLSIGESVKESNILVGAMSDEYSRTSSSLGGTMNKLKRLAVTQNSHFTWWLIFLIVITFIFLYYIFLR
ncbi:15075_t:CDS:2 [Funneliformis geosporum]|uniref:7622_t:CDS:1 n=1 Tax=Funneliformis geosporum TaxID=1117311 RepID=A0A9W4SRT1_9GLOM|nr:7622_t:CDS:2 [Funneliformis geosporum]CAI2194274.1 15075_t:CDS:2 [Funneliformis geosporum]